MSPNLEPTTPAATIATTPTVSGAGDFDNIPAVKGYEIYRELGRGGMGVVYKALQTSLGRVVALKMLRGSHATAEEMMRFRIEAEAVARFQHANIVQIYEVGDAEGRPYFSLEYIDGGSLEDRLNGKPMPSQQAGVLLAVLARAIHAAHLRGIVHRDLKPANILMGNDGTPKIADFGLAKRLDASSQTQSGIIMGTPSYMAPEQASGKSDEIGPAADIYALGAILYDLLTGRPPFEAENSLETIMQVLHREPLPPRTLQPKIPRDLDTICLKCLEKQPGKRYLSAQELAEDLDRYVKGEPILARPIGVLERAWRWCRRQPGWAALIAVSLLALVGFLVGGAWFTHQLQQELHETTLARRDAEQARQALQLTVVRETAEQIDSDLRQLAAAPRVVAAALELRLDWTEEQLASWLRSTLQGEPRIFGMAVAFEPFQFQADRQDYVYYVYRGPKGLTGKTLLPPEYTPLYREWDWYRHAAKAGSWSKPYVDQGGGEIPMVTFSVPFNREGRRAGVVTADLSLDYFRTLRAAMDQARVSAEAQGFVVTAQGIILSHSNAQLQFPASAADLAKQGNPDWADLAPRLRKRETGRATGKDFATGKPVQFLYSPVTTTGWSFVAMLPN